VEEDQKEGHHEEPAEAELVGREGHAATLLHVLGGRAAPDLTTQLSTNVGRDAELHRVVGQVSESGGGWPQLLTGVS
jgi:hypothetical protein